MASYVQRITYRKDGVQATKDVPANTPAQGERKLRAELGDVVVESIVTTVPPVA
jgi:hypothetical protein